jgi:hypothetical protein
MFRSPHGADAFEMAVGCAFGPAPPLPLDLAGALWLGCGMLVALAGVKSVPIGTVFRSKEQKCSNLVRSSAFLVLLSLFIIVVQGIIPARR